MRWCPRTWRASSSRGARACAIAAGADAGTPLNAHAAYATELELMVKYGMSPLDAIRAATSVAAEALGLGGETGRIAPGLAADLLAVAGNPAERIQALSDVRMVLARGRVARAFASASRRLKRPEPPGTAPS